MGRCYGSKLCLEERACWKEQQRALQDEDGSTKDLVAAPRAVPWVAWREVSRVSESKRTRCHSFS
jgi:hypothetical protein